MIVNRRFLLKGEKVEGYQILDESDVLPQVEYWRDQINEQFLTKYAETSSWI